MGTNNDSPIALNGLTKNFGNLTAVDHLTFSVTPGEVLGFLGPNGAGKTSTMRMLTGLSAPTSGDATVLGFDVRDRSTDMLARIGYIPGSLELYENQTGTQLLNFVSRIRKQDYSASINELAERLHVDLHRKIKDLSKGNRQKVGVIAAFMHNPDVLILDEPTSGLDPLVKREFELMLAEAKERGAAILLSSHILSEVEHLSSRVAIIDRGKLLMLDSMAELRKHAVHRIEFGFISPPSATRFQMLTEVRDVQVFGHRITCEIAGEDTNILKLAAELGATSVRTDEPNLDDIFLDLIEKGAIT